MVVADIRKFQILQEKYVPYKVSAELTTTFLCRKTWPLSRKPFSGTCWGW